MRPKDILFKNTKQFSNDPNIVQVSSSEQLHPYSTLKYSRLNDAQKAKVDVLQQIYIRL